MELASIITLDPIVAWILRASLALLFATAAFHKLRDLDLFNRTVAGYEILPRGLVGVFSLALVASEISIAIGLVAGGATQSFRFGLATSLLLAVYSAAIAVNLARGRKDIECGCLGPAAQQTLSGWLLVRNAILALAASTLLWPGSPRVLQAIDGITFAGGLIVVCLVFHAVNTLASISRFESKAEVAP